MLIPGTGWCIENDVLLTRAVPPDSTRDYSQFIMELRDASMKHYFSPPHSKSTTYNRDYIFHPENVCPTFQRVLKTTLSHPSRCSISQNNKVACAELHMACPRELFSNITDNDTCSCFQYVLSAQTHSIPLKSKVSNENLGIIRSICHNYTLSLLQANAWVAPLLAQNIAELIKAHFNNKTGIEVIIISEIQMKALIKILSAVGKKNYFRDNENESVRGLSLYPGSTYGSKLEIVLYSTNKVSVTYDDYLVKINNSERIELSGFLSILQSHRLSDFEGACFASSPSSESSQIGTVLAIIISVFASLLIAGGIFLYLRYTKQRSAEEPGRLIAIQEDNKVDDSSFESGLPVVHVSGDELRGSERIDEAINLSEHIPEGVKHPEEEQKEKEEEDIQHSEKMLPELKSSINEDNL